MFYFVRTLIKKSSVACNHNLLVKLNSVVFFPLSIFRNLISFALR